MAKKIYGVDLDQKVAPLIARDAVIECFRQAHCVDSGIAADDENMNQIYISAVIKKAFLDSGGDFDNPTKESIKKAIENLAEFAKNFRDPEIVKKHYDQIMKIIEKIS